MVKLSIIVLVPYIWHLKSRCVADIKVWYILDKNGLLCSLNQVFQALRHYVYYCKNPGPVVGDLKGDFSEKLKTHTKTGSGLVIIFQLKLKLKR